MTNAVSGASLVSGWLPIFGPETIAELEPVLAKMEHATVILKFELLTII